MKPLEDIRANVKHKSENNNCYRTIIAASILFALSTCHVCSSLVISFSPAMYPLFAYLLDRHCFNYFEAREGQDTLLPSRTRSPQPCFISPIPFSFSRISDMTNQTFIPTRWPDRKIIRLGGAKSPRVVLSFETGNNRSKAINRIFNSTPATAYAEI